MKASTRSRCAVAILWLAAASGCSLPPDQQAVADVEAAGGKIKINTEGEVIDVDLSRTKANDALVESLAAIAPTPALLTQLLVTNPQDFYRFDA